MGVSIVVSWYGHGCGHEWHTNNDRIGIYPVFLAPIKLSATTRRDRDKVLREERVARLFTRRTRGKFPKLDNPPLELLHRRNAGQGLFTVTMLGKGPERVRCLAETHVGSSFSAKVITRGEVKVNRGSRIMAIFRVKSVVKKL